MACYGSSGSARRASHSLAQTNRRAPIFSSRAGSTSLSISVGNAHGPICLGKTLPIARQKVSSKAAEVPNAFCKSKRGSHFWHMWVEKRGARSDGFSYTTAYPVVDFNKLQMVKAPVAPGFSALRGRP